MRTHGIGRGASPFFLMAGLVCLALTVSSESLGQEPTPAPAPGLVVLDTTGFWRMHHTLKPAVIQENNGLKPVLLKSKWLNWETSAPPADWMKAEFDDSRWGRFPARREAGTPYLAKLCLRGRFDVADPAKTQGLKLSVEYCGGSVIYLNGKEIARGHLPAGQTEIAEPYPEEVFVTDKGELLDARGKLDADGQRRIGLRVRKLLDVPIAKEHLRKGVNTLAIEIVRAPYHQVVALKSPPEKNRPHPDLNWNTCYLERVQLTSENAAGVVQNATRPPGFQMWNSDAMAGDFDLDWGDPCEPLRPIKLVGARNGTFSGKVIVGSTSPIKGLKATSSDLKGEGGAIPAAEIHIRYGLPWGHEYTVAPYKGPSPYPARENLFGALNGTPPQEVPVAKKPTGENSTKLPNQPQPVFGAVCPVWVTARVPKDAKAGLYRGEITIEASGEKPVKVPVEMKVLDWALPDAQDFQTWIEFVQSPDTLTVEYGMAPWSESHWRMIATSFELLRDLGTRTLYVPIIARSNLGNEYGMIRWLAKGEGKYDYDLSIMDKYLDCAERYLGKPKVICFIVWDVFMEQRKLQNMTEKDKLQLVVELGWYQGLSWDKYVALKKADYDPSLLTAEQRQAAAEVYERLKKERLDSRNGYVGKGPPVTVVNSADKMENMHLPPFSEPASMGLWKPLFERIREKLKSRGLENAAMLGFVTDVEPAKEDVQFMNEASGGMPWVAHAHHAHQNLYDIGKVAYATQVWSIDFPDDTSKFGWKNPRLVAQYQRGDSNAWAALRWRYCAEINITGSQRGIGRLGGDYWFAMKDKKGRRAGTVAGRYPEALWRNLDLLSHFLAPGPEGPVPTNRLYAIREGMQECEARVFIEKALTDETLKSRLGDELAGRAKAILDDRLLYIWKSFSHLQLTGPAWERVYFSPHIGHGVNGQAWALGPSTWQERSEKLYSLAGEVERKLAPRQ